MANKKYHHSTGIMNKMRDKMPLIIIILIIAFLATIVFEWGMDYLGLNSGNYVFAKVNGQEITYQEYEMTVQQRVDQLRANNPDQEIDDATLQQIRQGVWDEMVQNILLQQEIEKLGISVDDNEIVNWIYQRPETLPDQIRQVFIDSTGVFDYQYYQMVLSSKEPQVVSFWNQVESELRRTLLLKKLENVITSSILVTDQEVQQQYRDQFIQASFDYLLLPLTSINDPSINNVSDEELRQYYEAHKDEYRQQEAVRFNYLVVSEKATSQDSTDTENRIKALVKQFKELDPADSSFIDYVNLNSETKFAGDFQKPNSIRSGAMNFLMNSQPGQVSEILKDEDGIKIVRLIESKDGEEEFVKASHILVNIEGDTAQAKTKAMEILEKAKNGNFQELAFQLSDDPTAKTNRGNLGWFTKGAMVKEFEEAAFNNPTGSVIGPIKTQFGYHIIKVEGRTNKEFKFAELRESVKPGSDTKELTKIKAEEIYKQVEEGKSLDSVAAQYNLAVQNTGDVLRNGTIQIAPTNKSLVKFGFDNVEGSVHTPIKVQGGFAVFQISEKIQEGFKNFEEIKNTTIMQSVVQEKRFNLLKQKADGVASQVQGSSFESFAEGKPDFETGKVDSTTMGQPNMQIGMDYNLLRTVYSMEVGQSGGPIKGLKGYYFVKVTYKTPFNEQDYLAKAPEIRANLLAQKKQTVIQQWLTELKDRAEIEDNRDLFF